MKNLKKINEESLNEEDTGIVLGIRTEIKAVDYFKGVKREKP